MNKVTVPNNQQEIKENRPLSIYSFDPEAQAERDYEENLRHEMEDADDPDEQQPVAKTSAFEPQTVPRFMQRKFPPKEPLIEGVLYRRDQISLTGRRRHGKTTLLANI